MNNRERELRQTRSELVKQAKAILDGAEAASRDLNDEERGQYDGLTAKVSAMDSDIARFATAQRLVDDLSAPVGGGVKTDPHIGMDDKDVRQYSLVRAIRAKMNAMSNPAALREAAFEMECSDAVAQKLGKQPQGFYVPFDWLNRSMEQARDLTQRDMSQALARMEQVAREMRALTVGSTTGGGYTVQTDLLAQNFIELLRNRMVLKRAGALTLAGLVGKITIPAQSAAATAYWVAENGAPTISQQTFGQIAMSPNTIGAYTDMSRRLLMQSSIDVEGFVRQDLSTILAIGIDYAGFNGTGAGNNQPTGLATLSGVGVTYAGNGTDNTTNPNGAAPVWADLVNLETAVATANADMGALAYITNPKVRGKLKTVQKATYLPFIWDQANEVNGYSAYVTNQISSAATKGTGTGLSHLYYGNWNDFVIAMWGALDILVDPYTGSNAGTVRIVALQDVDMNVRHTASFARCVDIIA